MILALLALGCTGDSPVKDRAGPGRDSGATSGQDTGDSSAISLWQPSILAPTADDEVVECAEVCVTAELRYDGEVVADAATTLEIERIGVIGEGVTDADGRFTACGQDVPGGPTEVAATFAVGGEQVRVYDAFEVHPFGWNLGLQRQAEVLPELTEIPDFDRSRDNPVLADGADGDWDSQGVQSPHVLATTDGYRLYYSGRPAGDYAIGGATGTSQTEWSELPDNPLISGAGDDGWRSHAVRAPSVLGDSGDYRIWFAGRRSSNAWWTIGAATSTDGVNFTEVDGNPLLTAEADWEGESVSHPMVRQTGDVYELWYAGGESAIGYAVSTDGTTWDRYCHNPVLEGTVGTWDNDQVTAPAVVHDGEHYLMTYTGGGEGHWAVGYAESTDGVRWTAHTESVLGPQDPGTDFFESLSLFGSSMLVDDDTLHVWYGGSSATSTGIGYATAPRSAK